MGVSDIGDLAQGGDIVGSETKYSKVYQTVFSSVRRLITRYKFILGFTTLVLNLYHGRTPSTHGYWPFLMYSKNIPGISGIAIYISMGRRYMYVILCLQKG